MPAEGIHLTSLREALASHRLPLRVRLACVRHEDAARMGSVMLDLPYFDRYAEEVVRYVTRRSPRSSPYGGAIHDGAAIPILFSLIDAARDSRSDALLSLAIGVASHIAIDRQLHPLVNALARAHADGRAHDAAHREVEKFQSICFHETYFGRDRMGTPGIVRLVAVPMKELLAHAKIGDAISRAFAGSLDPAPSRAELSRMARGYEQHGWLLGSPIGKLVASEAEKDAARPKFLAASWGTFADVLGLAIAQSIAALEAAFAYYDATASDAPRARDALSAILPAGTIDPQGEAVDLARRFTPALSRHDVTADAPAAMLGRSNDASLARAEL